MDRPPWFVVSGNRVVLVPRHIPAGVGRPIRTLDDDDDDDDGRSNGDSVGLWRPPEARSATSRFRSILFVHIYTYHTYI